MVARVTWPIHRWAQVIDIKKKDKRILVYLITSTPFSQKNRWVPHAHLLAHSPPSHPSTAPQSSKDPPHVTRTTSHVSQTAPTVAPSTAIMCSSRRGILTMRIWQMVGCITLLTVTMRISRTWQAVPGTALTLLTSRRTMVTTQTLKSRRKVSGIKRQRTLDISWSFWHVSRGLHKLADILQTIFSVNFTE